MIGVTRVDYVRVPVDDIEAAKDCDPAGNRSLLHHRYEPYEQS